MVSIFHVASVAGISKLLCSSEVASATRNRWWSGKSKSELEIRKNRSIGDFL